MAQFDVYENPNPDTRESIPFLLDLQADLLSSLTTRVVAPLFREEDFGKPAAVLNPRFEIDGRRLLMSTSELAGIPARALGEKVGSLASQRGEIIAALDLLFTGI